jgi:hypothetical protein
VVEDNELTGPLPPHIPSQATFVDFHSNLFTGTIPNAWGSDAPMLNVLMVHDNNLRG